MRAVARVAGRTLIALTLFALATAAVRADDEAPAGKTLSPYFVVENGDAAVDALPLKSTDVKVRVLGVIAEVLVTQRYTNAGLTPLEARYVFPASTRAAVHAMNVRLGARLITANNVLQMHVGNILPGDDVRVELRYTELLVPTDGIYRFVYPTIVGPLYKGPSGQERDRPEHWPASPYSSDATPPVTKFSIAVTLKSPLPLTSLTSPSHELVVDGDATRHATVALAFDDEPADDRDFVLEYRLDGDAIRSGVLMSDGPDEKFFLAMVQPPAAVPLAEIVPREYVFIVDVSRSMHGFPLDTTRTLMRDLLPGLRPSDTFNLLLFAGDHRTLAPRSIPATAPNVRLALETLDDEPRGGGTELTSALREALAMPSERGRARVFVVITDGCVPVDRELFDVVRRNLSNASLFAFGIGSSVNRTLIEGLARAGQSEPFIVLDPGRADDEAQRFREMIEAPVMTNVNVRFEGLDTYDVAPGHVPDLFAQRPVLVFGKWRGDAHGAIVVEGTTASGVERARISVEDRAPSPGAGALRYLRATHRVAELPDQERLNGEDESRDAPVDATAVSGTPGPATLVLLTVASFCLAFTLSRTRRPRVARLLELR
jgi:Ca-activated chloride channel family protein